MHLKYVVGGEVLKDNDQKIEAVLEHYKQATDKNNPMRDRFQISPQMNGTLASNTESYDLYDDPRYDMIETMVRVLDEVYGLRSNGRKGHANGFDEANATGN